MKKNLRMEQKRWKKEELKEMEEEEKGVEEEADEDYEVLNLGHKL